MAILKDKVRAEPRRASDAVPTQLAASLRRSAVVMVRRLERRFQGGDGDLEESDVKLLANLATAVAKVMDLQQSPGKKRDGQSVEPGVHDEEGDGDVPQSVLDALEALADGRAAGLARLP